MTSDYAACKPAGDMCAHVCGCDSLRGVTLGVQPRQSMDELGAPCKPALQRSAASWRLYAWRCRFSYHEILFDMCHFICKHVCEPFACDGVAYHRGCITDMNGGGRYRMAHLGVTPYSVMVSMQTEFVGAGFMIGSAFAVVLPEGFEALYSAGKPSHDDELMHAHTHAQPHVRLLRSSGSVRAAAIEDSVEAHVVQHGPHHSGLEHHDHAEAPGPRWGPGAALLAGFLAMMLFEYLHHQLEGDGGHAHGHAGDHVCLLTLVCEQIDNCSARVTSLINSWITDWAAKGLGASGGV
jgi:hypothetical protein